MSMRGSFMTESIILITHFLNTAKNAQRFIHSEEKIVKHC